MRPYVGLWSYPEHIASRIDVVCICAVVVQLRTELVKTSAQKTILQIDEQRSTGTEKRKNRNTYFFCTPAEAHITPYQSYCTHKDENNPLSHLTVIIL